MYALFCAALFGALTWQVLADGPLRAADERLGRAMARHGLPLPIPIAEFFSDLGNTMVALPVLAVSMALAALRGHRAGLRRWWLPPSAAGLAMAVLPALVVPLKVWIARPGPVGRQLGDYVGYFPSGHTATAALAYGAAVLLLTHGPGRLTTRRAPALSRVAAVTVVALLNLTVGASLVRCRYHWPLDVLGSWCLSGVLLCAVAAAASAAGAPVPADRSPEPRPSEPRPSEPRPSEPRPSEARSAETPSSDSEPPATHPPAPPQSPAPESREI
ncbi:phosphatase PAP2 family protein [Streptomyces sp. H27-D2]|uniref:phosphatase PAP2 family protein n=1 Tax=Streptomyces sp. H27-D2 TaxID=3046304 RepID=UPI002DBAC4BF|nr:phosphatase PAP2 family protein [Streptomyces sp. H27-D2]MEC4020151.1 phosphatase PAP2 family protein [Streptomyces sp. H27-D2]